MNAVRHHRPRQPVRGHRVLPRVQGRPASTRSSATRPTSPPATRTDKRGPPPRRRRSHLTLLAKNTHRLQEPHQAVVDRVPGGLLLRPADRPGAAGGPQRGAHLPERLPRRRVQRAHPQGPAGRGRRSWPSGSPACSARTSTSRSRTTASTSRTSAPQGAIDIANRLGLPLVATADAHYLCAGRRRRPRRAVLHQHRQDARRRRSSIPKSGSRPVLRPHARRTCTGSSPTTRTPSPRSQEIADGVTSSSTSRSGTSPSSRRRRARRPRTTCANCASRG